MKSQIRGETAQTARGILPHEPDASRVPRQAQKSQDTGRL